MDARDQALADLEERVRRLEARLGGDEPREEPAAGGTAADTFWLLDALRERDLAAAVAFGGTAADADGAPVSWQITRGAEDLTTTDWTTSVPALAALGHPSRMQILQLVATGRARTAAELAHADGLGTTGQIYHHLRQLVGGGWLRVTTRGQHQVPPERLIPLFVVLAATSGP
ncbi:Helix-turn-helix domain-containing protein [Friedmanniella luteola]|uniref:Helix-turn-helix domain-containing protein n=1 Tax=Friedmanniella luteola TaxID=546871 RepID=A0A1H1MWG2_9ACTN|nr:helix-turn-helix domain-containing protein [Friedmanniella luteola]SDR91106.1 Helix-turn-helix domain-containing protein [Friedmanniella luteola]